ncbi:hypothetical protein GCM10009600_02120 [Oerskovia paurometabola]
MWSWSPSSLEDRPDGRASGAGCAPVPSCGAARGAALPRSPTQGIRRLFTHERVPDDAARHERSLTSGNVVALGGSHGGRTAGHARQA